MTRASREGAAMSRHIANIVGLGAEKGENFKKPKEKSTKEVVFTLNDLTAGKPISNVAPLRNKPKPEGNFMPRREADNTEPILVSNKESMLKLPRQGEYLNIEDRKAGKRSMRHDRPQGYKNGIIKKMIREAREIKEKPWQ